MRKHYLQAVHDYIRQNDVVEIAVERSEGEIFPLEQSYIEICLERPVAVREACAEGYRVELTEEQKTAPPSE